MLTQHPGDGYITWEIALGLQKALYVCRHLSRALFKSLPHRPQPKYTLVPRHPCPPLRSNVTILTLSKRFKILLLFWDTLYFPLLIKRFKTLFRIRQWGTLEKHVCPQPQSRRWEDRKEFENKLTQAYCGTKRAINRKQDPEAGWTKTKLRSRKQMIWKSLAEAFTNTAINPCVYKGLILYSEPPMWPSCASAYSART